MTSEQPSILVFIGSQPFREFMASALEGCAVEFVESPAIAREALAVERFDLVIITNLEVFPRDAVGLIPEDHLYPVLFLSGFMDPPLSEICRVKRIQWRPVPISSNALQQEVWSALETRH